MSYTMANSYLHFLPAAIFFALPTTFIITYFWSVAEDHVYHVLPNISETGALPPESCLFSMILNLTAFTMLFSVYVRHKEIVEVFRAKRMSETNPNAFWLNKSSTITGLIACGSLDVLANFQEATEIGYIHQLASVICFYGSALYLLQQSVLSAWMVPEISGQWLVNVRWFLGGLASLAVLGDTAFSSISYTYLYAEDEKSPIFANRTAHWTPETPGFVWHCISSVTQYVVVLALGAYIFTFCWDFKKITIFAPEIEMRTEPIPEPVQSLRYMTVEKPKTYS
uniref:DNA damage-regulated autophagy modulator protein 2 n=2 Tax=Lygus hesperus TaxID=30085 RepID=A0A0A9XC49_LYGHE